MNNEKLNTAINIHQNGEVSKAINLYIELINNNKENGQLFFFLGVAYLQVGYLKKALEFLKKSVDLNSHNPLAYYNLGLTFQELRNFDEAIDQYTRAIQLEPGYLEAYANLGVCLKESRRFDEALKSYEIAISINPNDSELYSNRGVVLKELSRFDESLLSYNSALKLDTNNAEIYYYRSIVHTSLKQYQQASSDMDKALTLNPDMHYLLGNFIHTKIQNCDWSNYEENLRQLINRIEQGKKISLPFDLLALADDLNLQKKSSTIFIQDKYPSVDLLPKIDKHPKHKKIRIGYFSGDFRNHATMHLIADLFLYHDKNQFEIYGFSFGSSSSDEWRERAIINFEQFIDVTDKSDKEIALISRKLEIDIAIDLKGFTENARPGIFSHRAAAIQVSYLGYPGTMGAEYIDYIIADPYVIPKNNQQYFSEKIAYLPNCYQPNVQKRNISNKKFTREEAGLPERAFVFCSFNNNYKITPEIFSSWVSILNLVEGSVLWLITNNNNAVENLKKEAILRGLSPNRLIFASFMPIEEHLKRIQLADLFLDTFPYNAHTTASDSLRVGLPIITRIGNTFASRVASSLLNNLELPELITTTQKEYESLAVNLANDKEKLIKIKKKLLSKLQTSFLFDSKLIAQHIELVYKQMYVRYKNNLPPNHIYISK